MNLDALRQSGRLYRNLCGKPIDESCGSCSTTRLVVIDPN